MTKKKVGIIALIIIIISAVVMVFAYGIKNKQVVVSEDDKMKIVVTSFPQYDFARAVAGDKANIQMLIKPGVETHSYEPTPDDIQKIQNADLFIYTGGENDHDNEEGHNHDHDEDEHDGHNHSSTDIEYDEHVWTSPLNAIKIVKKINAELDKIDSKNADTFDNNAEKYISEIKDIDSQIRDIVKHAKRKTLVFGDRFPFKYFVEEYGLDYKAAFPGCSDEMEPSAETVSYLVNFIRKENIPVVLYVELSNQKVADTLANETGTKTMCLNSAHNLSQQDFDKGVTYVSIMKENIKTLKAALQ